MNIFLGLNLNLDITGKNINIYLNYNIVLITKDS